VTSNASGPEPSDRAAAAPVGTATAPGNAGRDPMWNLREADGRIATGWALMPLRLFLGVTFLYAGVQKLANPDFLKDSSPTSIHAQLEGSVHSSPIHALIAHLVPIAPGVGLVIALGEVAIGAGILIGLWVRIAAVAGIALNLGLFLTVSFHSSPYFTGSDIVFVFAWTPLAVAGAAGAPALDTWLAGRTSPAAERPDGISRRAVLSRGALTGATAAVVLIGGGVVAVLGRAVGGTSTTSAASPSLSGSGASPSATSTTAPATSTTTGGTGTTTTKPSGTSVGTAASVPVGGSAAFTDPATGDPALVIQQDVGDYVAFDAVCPHAGCTVAYARSARLIACPCHGSEFNARTGAVLRGPATRGLTTISIIRGSDGDLYVPS
jgi:thiosulfate dehydrogenase [quinone] large subunit